MHSREFPEISIQTHAFESLCRSLWGEQYRNEFAIKLCRIARLRELTLLYSAALKDRGLKGVKLVISDKASGLVDILGDFFPAAQWQRCVVHWYRNAFSKCPYKHVKTVAAMLKAIHAQEDKEAARQKAALVAEKLRGMKLDSVAKFVEDSVEETLSYMDFPYEHWVKIRTNNGLERIMKEIRRRTRVVGSFPDGYSAMMLVGARLRHISTTKWGTRQYLCTCKIYEQGVV